MHVGQLGGVMKEQAAREVLASFYALLGLTCLLASVVLGTTTHNGLILAADAAILLWICHR
jgi:hypothetical protein